MNIRWGWKSLFLMMLLGCSIHVGNPKEFEGGNTKVSPQLSLILSGSGFETEEGLQLVLSKIRLRSSHSINDDIEFSGTPHFETSVTKANKWTSYLIQKEALAEGHYSEIEMIFKDAHAGSYITSEQTYPVNVEGNQKIFSIAADIETQKGVHTSLYISFDKNEVLIPQGGEDSVTSYALKNNFVTSEVKFDELLDDEEEKSFVDDVSSTAEFPLETGRLLHYDGTNLNSIFTDEGCTIPAVNDGDTVACWRELTGNMFGLVQDDRNRRATLRLADIGSLPTIEFDGTDDQYYAGVKGIFFSSHSIVFVGRFLDTRDQVFFSIGNLGENRSTAAGIGTGNIGFSFDGSNNIYYSPMPIGKPTILIFTYNGTDTANMSRKAYVNGVEQSVSSTLGNGGFLNIPDDSVFNLGNWNPIEDFRFNGHLSEFILYNRSFSSEEIEDISLYLKNKYQIP